MTFLTGILVAFLARPLMAATPEGAPTPRHAMQQARLFLKKGWTEDARKELEAALVTPEGNNNAELHWMLSQVCYDLMDIRCSLDHASLTSTLSDDADLGSQANEMAAFLNTTFGFLTIAGPQEGITSRLQVEPITRILDPDLKRYVGKIALDLHEKTRLPVEVALPTGQWLVNGQQTEIPAGRDSRIELPLKALGLEGLSALQVARLEVSTGFSVFFSPRLSNIKPGPEIQLGFALPVKAFIVGFTVDHSFRGYSVEGIGVEGSPQAWTAGVRIGKELVLDGPFALRPSIGYRFGFLPGLAFDCLESGENLACSRPGEVGPYPDARLIAVTPIHVPGLDISFDYRQAGRSNAIGMGLRFGLDEVIGVMPGDSKAHWSDEAGGDTFPVETEQRFFAATGIRLLANLSIAL